MRRAIGCAILALTLLGSGYALAEDWFFEVQAGVNSHYVWRGQMVTDDWVLQPAATIGIGGLSVSAWGNLELTNENGNEGEFSELNYILDYTFTMDMLQFSVGTIYYDYTNTPFVPNIPSQPRTTNTWEVYAGLGLDAPLSPNVIVYYDTKESYGFYALGSLSYMLDLTEQVGLALGASVGWGSGDFNNYYYGRDTSRISDAAFSVGLPLEPVEGLIVTPSVSYTTIIASSLRGVYEEDDEFVYGISAAIRF